MVPAGLLELIFRVYFPITRIQPDLNLTPRS